MKQREAGKDPHRTKIMRAVRRESTVPEIAVRKLFHRLGLRFRLHRKDLPGTPDIVLPRYKTVVFVHGCFWHQHPDCRYAAAPKTNRDYWLPKLAANVERDKRKEEALRVLGWRVLVIWECEIRDLEGLSSRIRREFSLR